MIWALDAKDWNPDRSSNPDARLFALVALAGLACALLPRLMVASAPVYPDSGFYLHAGMVGEAQPHLFFRYAGVIPIWVAGLFSDDPFVVSRVHGAVTAVLGIGAFSLLARAVTLSLTEMMLVLLLFAANVEAIALGGWSPLTDVTFGISIVLVVACFVLWLDGRCHPGWFALAVAFMVGTRLSGFFVILGLVALAPWRVRGPRAALVLGGWSAAAVLAYVLGSGWIVTDDPLWIFRDIDRFLELSTRKAPPRDRTLNNLAGFLIHPRALAVAIPAIWISVSPGGARFRPLLWSAAFVLLSYDVFDAISDGLAVRSRRFPPIYFLCFPMFAVFLVRSLGPRLALAAGAALWALIALIAASVEIVDVDWPYLLSEEGPVEKTKWLLVGLSAGALFAMATRRPWVLALAAIAALTVRGAADLEHRADFYQERIGRLHGIATMCDRSWPCFWNRLGLPLASRPSQNRAGRSAP